MKDHIIQALSRIAYAKTLGVQPIFMGDEFTLVMPFIDDNVGNPTLPALHGGCIGGFMEIAAVIQVTIACETPKVLPKPIGVNIDYLRRGRPEDTYARAEIFKKGSRVVNVRVRAWQEAWERPIATLHGHFLTAKPDA